MSDENKPWSTDPGSNRFSISLYLQEIEGGQLIPVPRRQRQAARYRVRLTIEYPTYKEEFEAKNTCTRFLDRQGVFHVDYGAIEEWRVRRCLFQWNLDEIFPAKCTPLVRQGNQLIDQSLLQWQRLPPLIRKAIATVINTAIGPI